MRKTLTSALIAAGTAIALSAAGLAVPAVAATDERADSAGIAMTASQSGFSRIEAQRYSSASGSILVQPSGDRQDPGNQGLALLRRDSRVSYEDVSFGTTVAHSVDLRLSSAVNAANGKVQIRRGGANDEVVGSLLVPTTASWQDYQTVRVPLTTPVTGTEKITLTFSADDANPFVNVNWLRFETDGAAPPVDPTPTPTPVPTPTPTQEPSPPSNPIAGLARIEAEDYVSVNGSVLVQPSGDRLDPANPGLALLRRGPDVTYKATDFGTAIATSIDLRLSSAVNSANGEIQIRTGGANGKVVGSVVVPKTASWQDYQSVNVPLTTPLSGTPTITLTFTAGDTNPFANLNWLEFASNGAIPPMDPTPMPTVPSPTPTPTPTPTPPPPPITSPVLPGFNRIEAENYSASTGPILKQGSGDPENVNNPALALLRNGNELSYNGVSFGSQQAHNLDVRIASATNTATGTIKVRRGGADGEVVGSLVVPTTASWQDYRTVRVPLTAALTGSNNITLTFTADDVNPFVNLNWVQFATQNGPAPTPPATPPGPTAPAQGQPGFVVKFVNNTDEPDSNVYVTADTGGNGNATYAGSVGNRFQPGLGNGVRLSDLNGPGTDPVNHTYTFVVNGNSGGRIYYSFGEPFVQHWPSAHDAPMRFDIAEFNITDGRFGPTDGLFYGNLSAVDQVGIPSNLQLFDGAGNLMQSGGRPANRDIACHAEVYDEIVANAPDGWDPTQAAIYNNDGSLKRLVAPNAAAERHPSLRPYVESLHGQSLRIRGRFAGGPGSGAGAYYDYTSKVDAEGNLYLRGTLTDPDDPSKPNAAYPRPSTIFIDAKELYGSVSTQHSGYGIYLQNGPMTLDGVVTGDGVANPYRLVPGTGRTTPVLNDLYGWIYGDLVTAYAFGYWGGKYGNDSSGFHGKPAFNDARTATDPFIAWSLWQQAIWNTSDSYGMSLGERFEAAGKTSPLIGTGEGAETMQITMKNGCSDAREHLVSGHGRQSVSSSQLGAVVGQATGTGQIAGNHDSALSKKSSKKNSKKKLKNKRKNEKIKNRQPSSKYKSRSSGKRESAISLSER